MRGRAGEDWVDEEGVMGEETDVADEEADCARERMKNRSSESSSSLSSSLSELLEDDEGRRAREIC